MTDPLARSSERRSGSRAGIVAVVGRANAGKSTLVNAILEEKISIVSPVAQTTRTLVRAILTEPRGQIVFLDTPGVHKADYDLGRLMNRTARAAVEGVDAILLVFDSSQAPREEDEGWVRRMMGESTPCVAVLNKSDKASRAGDYRRLWEQVAREKSSGKQAEWIAVSGLERSGVGDLLSLLFRLIPEGPLLFPEDIVTDYPRKLAMADVVREHYFNVLREELPHSLAVEVEKIDEAPDGWKAQATIYVQKNSQKGIVIGNKGRLLKQVRERSEKDLADMYGRPVSLELWVKVDKDWTRNFWTLKRLGYAP